MEANAGQAHGQTVKSQHRHFPGLPAQQLVKILTQGYRSTVVITEHQNTVGPNALHTHQVGTAMHDNSCFAGARSSQNQHILPYRGLHNCLLLGVGQRFHDIFQGLLTGGQFQ